MTGKEKDARVVVKNPNTGRDMGTIARDMYEPVRAAILDGLAEEGEISFGDLKLEVLKRTPTRMWEKASVSWYTTSVKLDLEARGLVQREGSPQVLGLTEKGRNEVK